MSDPSNSGDSRQTADGAAAPQPTVAILADHVGGRVVGAGETAISGVADLRFAGPSQIGFLRDSNLRDLARSSGAGAILVAEDLELACAQIVVAQPFAAFAKIALLFHPVRRAEQHRVHPAATVDPSAVLHEPVEIEAGAVVEAGAEVGAGAVVGAGSVVGAGARLGRDCVLHPRVVLYAGTVLGDRVAVHSGAVVGSDGFGYAPDGGQWIKLPQIGNVVVGDDVEIGAGTTIDCGTLGATSIGRGTKIDNHVHIGHNCVIGEDCAIAGFTALSGSVTIGNRVTLAGHVVCNGHLKICDDVRIGGASVVHTHVKEPGDYLGYPIQPKRTWFRTMRAIDRLVTPPGGAG